MEAHLVRCALVLAAVCSMGASYRTPNFVVEAPTPQLAQEIGKAAETFRRDLAIEWLGKEMPNWGQPCPLTAQVADHLGAGGATSFVFDHGEVFGWRMTIQGSRVRILDSVLPHEVTHTIFATHFRQPLPRWADEGACTTVEHESERRKQQVMLIDFLRSNRGIAFSQMFMMKDYPQDVMPLYSQGYSLARFLIAQGGKQKFLAFIGDGMRDENWTRAIKKHYEVDNLASLQTTWLDWVRKGSPKLETAAPSPGLVAVKSRDGGVGRPGSNLIYRGQEPAPSDREDSAAEAHDPASPSVYALASRTKTLPAPTADAPQPGWRAPRPVDDADEDAAQEPAAGREASELLAGNFSPPIAPSNQNRGPIHQIDSYQATRPQEFERSRQIILEWSRPPGSPVTPPPATAPLPGPSDAR